MSNVRGEVNLHYPAALEYLFQELKPTLLNIILNAKRGQVLKWVADPSLMSDSTKKLVANLYDVVTILRAHVSGIEAQLWLTGHSDFLFGIPAQEIRSRPEDVRMAALNMVTRGEDYEIRRSYGAQE